MDLNGFINLDKICILLADSSPQGMDILSQIFTGFGARNITRCASIALASDFIRSNDVDLIVVNDTVGTESGYDFVHWLRRQEGNQNVFTPAIMISGHTKRSIVGKARDCGANFLIAKPVSPQVVLERVIWVAREKRPFLEAGDYIGPDRRHHEADPGENKGRRRNDQLLAEAEAAAAAAAEAAAVDVSGLAEPASDP